MRSWSSLLILLGAAQSFAEPAIVKTDPPCPTDLPARLIRLYPNAASTGRRVEIAACVFGNFAGPGWIVVHFTPFASGAKPEVAPDGGEVFVRASDQSIVARTAIGDSSEGNDVRALDLDGDGVDEIVTLSAQSATGDVVWSAESLAVSRVRGTQIVSLFFRRISEDAPDDDRRCKGTLTVEPGPDGARYLVVTSTRHGKGAKDCLAPGRHVFGLSGGRMKEIRKQRNDQ